MLQAFIDDSGGDQQGVLVLGGYVATAGNWAAFSDEWTEALSLLPGYQEFKMSEVARWWDEDDFRLKYFYRIIEKYVDAEFAVVMPLDAYQAAVAKFPSKISGAKPYYMLFHAILEGFADRRHELGLEGKMEFFFDEQTAERKEIHANWDNIWESAHWKHKQLLARTPAFGDSKELLPLQAADMLVWWQRKKWEETEGKMGNWVFPWSQEKRIPSLKFYYSEQSITNNLWHFTGICGRGRSTYLNWAWQSAWAWRVQYAQTLLQTPFLSRRTLAPEQSV